MIARRITLRGRVQGVGFRESMVDAARALGVSGWVRNRGDGSVEALVQGEPDAVERAIAWCRRGPPVARVTEVVVADEPVSPALSEFVRRATE
jgi:acylphosphatase